MKKLASLIICVLLVFTLIGCNSNSYDSPSQSETIVTKTDSLIETANIWLMTQATSAETTCYLGNQLSSYRLTDSSIEPIDYEIYPIFSGDKIIALAHGTTNDQGEYITSCGVEFAEELQLKYVDNPDAEIAIVYASDGVYLVSSSGSPVLLHEQTSPDFAPITEFEKHCHKIEYQSIGINTSFSLPG